MNNWPRYISQHNFCQAVNDAAVLATTGPTFPCSEIVSYSRG